MVTKFKRGKVSYSLVTSSKSLRDWDIPLSAIKPDPSVWSKRDKKRLPTLQIKHAKVKKRSLGICE